MCKCVPKNQRCCGRKTRLSSQPSRALSLHPCAPLLIQPGTRVGESVPREERSVAAPQVLLSLFVSVPQESKKSGKYACRECGDLFFCCDLCCVACDIFCVDSDLERTRQDGASTHLQLPFRKPSHKIDVLALCWRFAQNPLKVEICAHWRNDASRRSRRTLTSHWRKRE